MEGDAGILTEPSDGLVEESEKEKEGRKAFWLVRVMSQGHSEI